MTMESSPPGRVLPDGTIRDDRALPQSASTSEWTNGTSSGTAELDPASKRPILKNRTGSTQTKPTAVSPSPILVSNVQSKNLGPKTGFRPGSAIENGISHEASAFVKKDSRVIISADRSVHSHRSITPSPSPISAANGHLKQEPPPLLERADSVQSKGSSHQARYHDNCTPQIDPTLIIGGSRRRTPSPRFRSRRPNSFKRPVSEISLLGRRESVTNLVFSGPSAIDHSEEDSSGWETIYKKRLSFGTCSYASSLFSRMASPLREPDVTPGEFDVMEDDDYSTARLSKMSSASSTKQRRVQPPCRPGFLYQVMAFDYLAKDVPPFVKSYAQKNGKMISESFILKVNYLRRRRQLGEVSSTINIGSSHSKRPATSGEKVTGSPR